MHGDVILMKVCPNDIVMSYRLQCAVWTTDPKSTALEINVATTPPPTGSATPTSSP